MRVQLAVVILSLALSSVWSAAGVKQLIQRNGLKLGGLKDALDAVANETAESQAQIESGIHSLSKMLDSQLTTEEPDYCGNINYTVLDEAWRSVNASSGTHCDKSSAFSAGWYRFLLNGTNSVIPTSCLQTYHCSCYYPVWLDLQGQAMPGVSYEIQAKPCGSYYGISSSNSTCCNWAQPTATVRNCGSYYIYQLQPITTGCYFAYCATPM